MDLTQPVKQILSEHDDYHAIKTGIEEIYGIFSESTGIYAGNLTTEKLSETANGKVVSPVHAAHCVKDLMRTTKFLRGVHAAIQSQLQKKPKVHVLYAGCGPYATLTTPLTSVFTSDQVQFTLLDIEQVSIDAVSQLYSSYNLQPYVARYLLADATDPDLTFDDSFDVIISETMQVGLKNECQVPITRNLVKFLTKDGVFVPEKVTLKAALVGDMNPLEPKNAAREILGTAYDLDFKNVPKVGASTIIKMVESDLNYLELQTEIKLFDDIVLYAFESGLTIPLTLDRYPKGQKRPKELKFTYKEGVAPDLLLENIW